MRRTIRKNEMRKREKRIMDENVVIKWMIALLVIALVLGLIGGIVAIVCLV